MFFSTDVKKAILDSQLIFVCVNTPTKTYGVGKVWSDGILPPLGDLFMNFCISALISTFTLEHSQEIVFGGFSIGLGRRIRSPLKVKCFSTIIFPGGGD